MPRVTVIIATYNWSSVLPFSVGSVLRQTFSDWELLVVGDGCTDDSPAAVETLAQKDGQGRIRWINLPFNSGNQSGPNNEGLAQARGELIAYLGHDDLWLPHHLECLVAAIDGGADLAHSVIRWVCPPGEAPRPHDFAPQRLTTPSAVMHRRSVTHSVGGWRDARELTEAPDRDLWRRIRQAGHSIVLVPRLGVVKIPAIRRRNVYKTTPSHEQAAWFERIGKEANFETTQLTQIICDASDFFDRPAPGFGAELSALVRRLPQRLTAKWRRLRPERVGAKIEASRALRGLDPKP